MEVEVSLPWPAGIPQLKRLDELLRCGICYEFMSTSMVTLCSHNYCSLCIRQYLTYKTQCPVCFKTTSDQHLRNNRLIDEIIILFPALRDKVARLSQSLKGGSIAGYFETVGTTFEANKDDKTHNGETRSTTVTSEALTSCATTMSPSSKSRTEEALSFGLQKPASGLLQSPQSERTILGTPKRTPGRGGKLISSQGGLMEGPSTSASSSQFLLSPSSSSRLKSPVGSNGGSLSPVTRPNHLPSSGSSVSGYFSIRSNSESNEGGIGGLGDIERVPCPVCHVEVPQRNINIHLDTCLKSTNQTDDVIKAKQESKRKALPKMVYALLSDKQLKQKLREAGLSSIGDKTTLINRHKRYTTLYNAECDVPEPRSAVELARQVEKEERDKTKATTSIFSYDRKTAPEVIEKEQTTYLKKNNNHFANLIADIKQRQAEKNVKNSTGTGTVDEERGGEERTKRRGSSKVSYEVEKRKEGKNKQYQQEKNNVDEERTMKSNENSNDSIITGTQKTIEFKIDKQTDILKSSNKSMKNANSNERKIDLYSRTFPEKQTSIVEENMTDPSTLGAIKASCSPTHRRTPVHENSLSNSLHKTDSINILSKKKRSSVSSDNASLNTDVISNTREKLFGDCEIDPSPDLFPSSPASSTGSGDSVSLLVGTESSFLPVTEVDSDGEELMYFVFPEVDSDGEELIPARQPGFTAPCEKQSLLEDTQPMEDSESEVKADDHREFEQKEAQTAEILNQMKKDKKIIDVTKTHQSLDFYEDSERDFLTALPNKTLPSELKISLDSDCVQNNTQIPSSPIIGTRKKLVIMSKGESDRFVESNIEHIASNKLSTTELSQCEIMTAKSKRIPPDTTKLESFQDGITNSASCFEKPSGNTSESPKLVQNKSNIIKSSSSKSCSTKTLPAKSRQLQPNLGDLTADTQLLIGDTPLDPDYCPSQELEEYKLTSSSSAPVTRRSSRKRKEVAEGEVSVTSIRGRRKKKK